MVSIDGRHVSQAILVVLAVCIAVAFFRGPPQSNANNPRNDPLFSKIFPVCGKVELQNGYISNMPFHIYDNDATSIFGTTMQLFNK
jgi:hypothetical protein